MVIIVFNKDNNLNPITLFPFEKKTIIRISHLIGKGLPCHGSRCRFESGRVRILLRKSCHWQGETFAKRCVMHLGVRITSFP